MFCPMVAASLREGASAKQYGAFAELDLRAGTWRYRPAALGSARYLRYGAGLAWHDH